VPFHRATTVLYVHGFRSSSQSRKAKQLGAWIAEHRPEVRFLSPDLSFDPATALTLLETACGACVPSELTLVGSSLGGFYALVLAERFGCKAVLLNPSLRPYETLRAHLGAQTNLYSGEPFVFEARHLDFLRVRAIEKVARPENYFPIVEMGDELLDHRRTLEYFAGSHSIVVTGGDHELKSFPQHIPRLIAFAEGG